ncbi:MAG: hypothetical protein SPD96_03885 [Paludibacteraceae bacterium]|nr:hypothetical protein [Paludibacteraceae bacterium]
MLRQEYKDILAFAITLLVANYAWKWSITGDDGSTQVLLWQTFDISCPFKVMNDHIARAVYALISVFRDTAYMTDPHTIRFASGSALRIVWSCTALKQSFIWLCLLLTTHGGWKHKTWFIPLGWLCIYLFNIARIAAIAMLIEAHPTWFEILHTYVFKYLFYIMLFALWLLFTEKIRKA